MLIPELTEMTEAGTTKNAKSTKVEFDDLSNRVIGCVIEFHRQLGPGPLNPFTNIVLCMNWPG